MAMLACRNKIIRKLPTVKKYQENNIFNFNSKFKQSSKDTYSFSTVATAGTRNRVKKNVVIWNTGYRVFTHKIKPKKVQQMIEAFHQLHAAKSFDL
jgi:hypothetical protein